MSIELIDVLALAWFLICWVGYVVYADRSPACARSLAAHMGRFRVQWMRVMLRVRVGTFRVRKSLI